MTRLTKRHQIFFRISAALGYGDNMVNLGRRTQPSGLLAMNAQGVFCKEQHPDLFPLPSVVFAFGFITLRIHKRLMFGTVFSVCQLRAEGIGAWMFRFIWHNKNSSLGIIPVQVLIVNDEQSVFVVYTYWVILVRHCPT